MQRRLAVIASFALLACGGDGGTGPTNNGGTNSMQATVQGVAFAPTSQTVGASYASGVFTLQGSTTSSPYVVVQINVTNATGAGTYNLSPGFAGDFGQVSITDGSNISTWTTVLSPGTGTITFSTLTATRAQGTFQFTGQEAPGTSATGQRSVTSGTFNVTF
jgi:hypothetical protein